MICLIDTIGVDLEVQQAMALRLISAEVELTITSLSLPNPVYQVLVGDFFRIWPPCVRKYNI